MRSILKVMFVVLPLFVTSSVFSQTTPDDIQSSEAYKIGEMVQLVQGALDLRDESSMQTISLYGTDSRYYSMIRGWLFQELVGVESQLHASKDEARTVELQAHSDFLKQSIRLIDLE